jgi:hypothetical protein
MTTALAFAAMVLLVTQAPIQAQHQSKFLSKQCNEDAIELRLDPAPLEDLVGPAFSLALEDGKARVVIVIQDCSQYWIDGEDLGSSQDIHVWVAIQGPNDIRPVIGAERTMPTRTWFALFVGCSNPRVREAKMASGIALAPIEGVSLDPPGPQQGGSVSLCKNLKYSWEVPSPAVPPARLVGLNHDVYSRDPEGNVILNRVQTLMHMSAGPSQGTPEVVGETGPLPFISPGTYSVSVTTFFPMWSRANLGLSPAP